jgi:hypothetical protein
MMTLLTCQVGCEVGGNEEEWLMMIVINTLYVDIHHQHYFSESLCMDYMDYSSLMSSPHPQSLPWIFVHGVDLCIRDMTVDT